MTTVPPAPTATPALAFIRQNRNFSLFWAALFMVNIAVQVEAVTIGWQIYAIGRLTRSMEESAFLVGMVGLAQFVPLFFLTLWAGSLADRISRRRIVVVALAVEVVCSTALALVAQEAAPNVVHIFAIAAMFGAARAFLSPAATATVPMLVARPDMPRAISLKSLAWQTAVIIGPWIGGLLCGVDTALAYGVTAGLYAAGLGIVLLMRANTTPERQKGSPLALIREGIVYTWQNKIILGAMSLDLFAVLLGGATALLPAFARDILNAGPEGFGILRSGPAVGAVIMALVLARWPLVRKAGLRMFLAVGAFGLATVVFALSRSMVLSVLALAVLGAADMVSVYVRQTLVQIVTPDHMRGRVSSVSGLFISGSNELGEFESGVVSRLIGPVMAAAMGGLGTLFVTGLWAWMFPALRNADRLDASPDAVQHHTAATPASPV